MSAEHFGRFAEILTSPDYRQVVNAAWADNANDYQQQQNAAEDILFEATAVNEPALAQWEARRLAALDSLNGNELGRFGDYLHAQGGRAKVSELSRDDLDLGEIGPVKTNSIIKGIGELYDDPIDFLNNALGRIDSRKTEGPSEVGPENYATALKFFADKYNAFPSQNLDQAKIKALVSRCTDGFTLIASKDKPNFVEMTNLYQAVRLLPYESFTPEFTDVLLEHSLEQLPTYHRQIMPIMFHAISKLPIVEHGAEAATLLDLAMRQMDGFETTKEMRFALRAVCNLPRTSAANRTFGVFLELRNNLEEPLDMGGLDETSELLLRIVNLVIDDPTLTLQAQEMSKTCASQAIKLYRLAEADGDLSDTQLVELHRIVDRIVNNWSNI